MSKGFIAQPSFDAEGNFSGVEIGSGHTPMSRQGVAPQGWSQDEVTGETTVFEDVASEVDDVDNAYVEALHELHPDIPNALDYLVNSGVWSIERQQQHDRDIEDKDLTVVSAAVEKMMDEYQHYLQMDAEHQQSQPKQEQAPVDEDEDSDIPDISSLYEAEPNEDFANQWDEYAANTEGAYSLLAGLAAQFHSGEITDVDELMQIALDSDYSREELIAAYNHLSGKGK
jgi:hypothetical protein